METVERKYAMTRIATGDYLLPSNDAQTLYRLRSYVDGPSGGLDWPRDRTLWCVARWVGELDPNATIETLLDMDRWDDVATCLDTRREAIVAALSEP